MAKQAASTLIVTSSTSKPEGSLATLLLVDDREPDILITTIMLEDEANLKCNLLVARDGQEALAVLQGEITEGRQIDLVLLDINMPRLDGFELLECMRGNEAMKRIEVVMCTGSIAEKDRKRAESLGAIGYVLKPTLFAKLKPILERTTNTHLFRHEGDGYSLLRAG